MDGLAPVFLLLLVLSVAAGYVGFRVGERRRGADGPRPARSIGEALSQLRDKEQGRVVVLFLAREERAESLQPWRGPELRPVVIPSAGEDRDVARHLYSKYLPEEELPHRDSALLLDAEGAAISSTPLPEESGELRAWLERQPLRSSRPRPEPDPPGGRDQPMAEE